MITGHSGSLCCTIQFDISVAWRGGRDGDLASRQWTFSLSFPLVQRRSSSVRAWDISCLSVLEERLSGTDEDLLFQGAACRASKCKKFPNPFQTIKSLKQQQTAEWPPFSLALTIPVVLY